MGKITIDENKLGQEILARFKGRIVLALAAAVGAGFALGIVATLIF